MFYKRASYFIRNKFKFLLRDAALGRNTCYAIQKTWIQICSTQRTAWHAETISLIETVKFRFSDKLSQWWSIIEGDIKCLLLPSVVCAPRCAHGYTLSDTCYYAKNTHLHKLLKQEIRYIPLWQNFNSFIYEYIKDKI